MSRIPTRLADFVNWANLHGPLWDTNHVALGLSVAQSGNFKTAAITAQTKYNDQLNAIELAKAATVKQQDATRDARTKAADCIRTIAAFAATQTDPNAVYTLAQIDPPAPPSPAPPPGIPTDFTAALENNGAVTFKWKAINAGTVGATVWTVMRRAGGTGSWGFVGASGRRTFTDNTIPAGVTNVQYQVQGQRGDAVGESSLPFTVQFGNSGGGLMIAAQFSEGTVPQKLAA